MSCFYRMSCFTLAGPVYITLVRELHSIGGDVELTTYQAEKRQFKKNEVQIFPSILCLMTVEVYV